MVLHLINGGREALTARARREYIARLPQEELTRRIEACRESKEVERIMTDNDLCDYCDFCELNVNISKMLANIIVKVVCRFPRMRSRICFVGCKCGYIEALKKIEALDKDTISKFKIQNMFINSDYVEMAKVGLNIISNTEYGAREFNILAQALNIFGLLDAIILDENDFSGLGYVKACNMLRVNALNGYHPKDCGGSSYIVYHELGHIMDALCDFTDSKEFLNYYNNLKKEQIITGLSQYAATNKREFFAEAFAEYMSSDSPRKIAEHIGIMLIQKYKCSKAKTG